LNWFLLGIIIVTVLLIPTAYAGWIGAPYAPTRLAVVHKAFDGLGLDSEDYLVDLGAGDGGIMREAAARGMTTLGYELSPIMWLIAWVRTRRLPRSRLRYQNFYKAKLPEQTTVIFSFLMPTHMTQVFESVARQELPRAHYFLSYAFPVPNTEPALVVREKNCAPLYVYDLAALVSKHQKDA